MHRYEGPGELALAAGPACRLIAARLELGDDLVVERHSFVAVSPDVTVDVALTPGPCGAGQRGRPGGAPAPCRRRGVRPSFAFSILGRLTPETGFSWTALALQR